jgi:muramidase (phage lysozyme)
MSASAQRTAPNRSIRVVVVAAAVLLTVTAAACQPVAPVGIPDFNLDGRVSQDEVDRHNFDQLMAFFRAVDAARRSNQLNSFLVCVRQHESDRGPYPHVNGYTAQNPRSTASGAYQFLDSTWRNVAPKVGAGQYARAKDAPWWVQDDAALWMINNGWRSAWNGTGC